LRSVIPDKVVLFDQNQTFCPPRNFWAGYVTERAALSMSRNFCGTARCKVTWFTVEAVVARAGSGTPQLKFRAPAPGN